MCEVVNLKKVGYRVLKEPRTIRIDRQTKWGNPFIIGRDGSRNLVITKYRVMLWKKISEGQISVHELAGMAGCKLACWCKPLPCHGDVLNDAISWAYEKVNGNEK